MLPILQRAVEPVCSIAHPTAHSVAHCTSHAYFTTHSAADFSVEQLEEAGNSDQQGSMASWAVPAASLCNSGNSKMSHIPIMVLFRWGYCQREEIEGGPGRSDHFVNPFASPAKVYNSEPAFLVCVMCVSIAFNVEVA